MLFEDRFVGLNTKSYSEKYQLLDASIYSEQLFEEKWKRLLSFIHINKRPPRSGSRNEEVNLYDFFNRQKNKLSRNELTVQQTKQVNDLIQLIKLGSLNFVKKLD